MEWLFELKDIKKVAKEFWKYVGERTVFAFYGPMGIGKTTFIHSLCDEKNVKSVVSSPTFSIINEYEYELDGIRKKLYHLDLYRLRDEEEARQAGVEDALYSGNICLVEWPERAEGIFPDDTVRVTIELINEETRRLQTKVN